MNKTEIRKTVVQAIGQALADGRILTDIPQSDYDRVVQVQSEMVEEIRLKGMLNLGRAPAGAEREAAVLTLVAFAEGRIEHLNEGLCPDIVEGHDTRDRECKVCQALITLSARQ